MHLVGFITSNEECHNKYISSNTFGVIVVVWLRDGGPWNCVYIRTSQTNTGIQSVPYLIGIWSVYSGIERPVGQANKLSPSNSGINL